MYIRPMGSQGCRLLPVVGKQELEERGLCGLPGAGQTTHLTPISHRSEVSLVDVESGV